MGGRARKGIIVGIEFSRILAGGCYGRRAGRGFKGKEKRGEDRGEGGLRISHSTGGFEGTVTLMMAGLGKPSKIVKNL